MALVLHATPLSHFARKVRIVLAELAIAHEVAWTSTVTAARVDAFGDNPLMRVPTLVADGEPIVESDHIARYLVARFDPGDRLGVTSGRIDDANRLAVINGIMANEVTILLAKRSGLVVDGNAYFAKLAAAIDGGLAWLDARCEPDLPAFDYRDGVLAAMWQHAQHYQLVHGSYPRLAARVARFVDRPSIASTTPERAVADATAAGWAPPR